MQLIGAALIGMMRATVPPQAMPEPGVTVSKTATTNLGLDDEARRLMSQTVQQRLAAARVQQGLTADDASDAQAARKAQEPTPTEQAFEPPHRSPYVADVWESSQIGRVDRPHRVTREEALDPTDLGAQEVQLLQARYRDEALISSAARALLLKKAAD